MAFSFTFPPDEKHAPPPSTPQSPAPLFFGFSSTPKTTSSFNPDPSAHFRFSPGNQIPSFTPPDLQPQTDPPPSVQTGKPRSAVSETPDNHAFGFPCSNSPEGTVNSVTLEVVVEKKSDRVVFAESNDDFIDILLSLLTLPIGSIVKMTKGLLPFTSIGCMNNIYKSVETLDAKFFNTEACREMLLSPRSSSEAECNDLKLKIGEDSRPCGRCFYFCKVPSCRMVTLRLSEFPNVCCSCGELMSQSARENLIREDHGEFVKGGFVKGVTDMFLISDDLQLMPGSTSLSLALLKKSGIGDANELVTRSFTVGSEEVLQLLRLTLISKAPLTDWIRLKQGDDGTRMAELQRENLVWSKSQGETSKTSGSKQIKLTLFRSRSKEKILFAECGEDFVDFLFSFLTFPLGSILQLFDGSSSVLGGDNLYKSVKDLGRENYFKSEELKNLLIKPNLAPFRGCENQFFDFQEALFPSFELHCSDSKTEWSVSPVTATKSGPEMGRFVVMNPKCSDGRTSRGGGFVKAPAKFMVTDGLDVMPLSVISSVSILAKSNVPISDVDTTMVTMGIGEALNLLEAALVSETPLSDVFNKQCNNVV